MFPALTALYKASPSTKDSALFLKVHFILNLPLYKDTLFTTNLFPVPTKLLNKGGTAHFTTQ